jgi:2'-5' RNA ligase
METVRFIIITTLPEDISSEIENLRKKLSRVTGSCQALTYPPHITLRTGVVVPADEILYFIKEFGEIIKDVSSFNVETDGLKYTNYLSNGKLKNLIIYKIMHNPELCALNLNLLIYEKYKKSNNNNFKPHLTLAFDDLSRDGFNDGCSFLDREEILNYKWTCDNISLFQFRENKWVPYHIFKI